MHRQTYTPQPVDTSSVELPEELLGLVERLAEHVHDVWARQRIGEGWTYGELRDGERKTHPDLVPYAELPDGEKAYDRNTTTETLKVILSLGYRIVRDE